MFDRILIANRGEIACRVIVTARRIGVQTVAVYSEVDRHAKHVALADVAMPIGGAAPAESYLNGSAIIDAAVNTGAQAIHPGYGFLSENPDFVAAVEAAGLVFIGPSSDAIRKMGLKDAAKALMEQAGVPVVPGYHGPDQNIEVLRSEAEKIGYPVLIKAVAGGGGKGMRLVMGPEEFSESLAAAQSEAIQAFGNGEVLIEKYIQCPRHIEIQVFGDRKRAVHLFERDCSLQRRHQKVIEEAPAPGMTGAMRDAMGKAAVRAAEAIRYSGAGTVEFIVDSTNGLKEDRFWFMEMNTRLQVEHPVTEAITGVDLVEWQLRVAAGEGVPVTQDDLQINGHAFEARLYAEDVPKGFLPATGTLTHLRFPDGVRIDSGVRAGDEISPFYDPMIAKLTTHAPTRSAALRQLSVALAQCELAGTVTNLSFLGALVNHPGFGQGEVDTGLIGRDLDDLVTMPVATSSDIALAGMAALGLLGQNSWSTGFSLWSPTERQLILRHAGEDVSLSLRVLSPDLIEVDVNNETVRATRVSERWQLNGQIAPPVAVAGTTITVFSQYGLVFECPDPLDRDGHIVVDSDLIIAPMPGLVKSVQADIGQCVKKGDRLAVLEAMKMEHALLAARDGTIAEVLVATGDQVAAGAGMIRLYDQAGKAS